MSVSERDGGRQMSPLRRRMTRDMELAGLTSGTRKEYVRAVVRIVRHCGGKRPELITEEEVYRYILWLRDERGVAKGTFQVQVYGLKFFFYRTLDRNWALFSKKRSGSRSRSVFAGRCPGRNAAA